MIRLTHWLLLTLNTLALWLALSASTASAAGKLKVGLVLDKGGRDDKSFNAAAFKGATEAQSKLGIDLKVVEASDDTSLEPSLRTFAQRGYDLVIGIGFVQRDPIKKVAVEFPKTQFLVVDTMVDLPNVRAIMFEEQEGAYLVGAIAALTSKTKTVGFVGGMDIPLIRRFELGFRTGAEKTVPGTKVITNYVGTTGDSWKNPTKGKELAMSQYHKNADIIFVAAGASGLGVFDAAEELKKLAIGVDSNQNGIKPGRILTSMLKRIDAAVYNAIEDKKLNRFKPGQLRMGLKESGVDYALDSDNRALLTPEIEKKANAIKTKIIEKQIRVPDYYELNGIKTSANP